MRSLACISTFSLIAVACGSFAAEEGDATDPDAGRPAAPVIDAAGDGDLAPVDAAAGPCPVAPTDPTLVAWYPFEETDEAVIRDCSGHGLDGTLATPGGFARIDGRPGRGRAADFQNGACFDLGTAAPLKFDGAFTVAAWVKARKFSFADPDASGGLGPIWFVSYFSSAGGIQRGWGLGTDDEKAVEFKLFAQDGGLVETETDTVADTWVHVAGIYEPGRIQLYLSGGLAGTVSTSMAPGYAAESRGWIGCREQGTPTFEGSLDDVRIYGRALSLVEIQALAL